MLNFDTNVNNKSEASEQIWQRQTDNSWTHGHIISQTGELGGAFVQMHTMEERM